MKKIPCSVPILTLNSGKHLAKCLESVRDFEDVFIVDGNSTDDTQEIAKRLGVSIYKQADTDEPNVRISDFSAMRLRIYGFAKADWILILDSDEYISEALADEIRSIILHHEHETDIAFRIEKRAVIAGREIDYAFNQEVPIRLYNERSGVGYRTGKLVHEQLHVPPHTRILTLKHSFYSDVPASYRACVAKDDYYLSLVWQKMVNKRKRSARNVQLGVEAVLKSFFRAAHIFVVSLSIYMRHGYAHSLPFPQVIRHVRYHLLLGVLRCRQLILNLSS